MFSLLPMNVSRIGIVPVSSVATPKSASLICPDQLARVHDYFQELCRGGNQLFVDNMTEQIYT